MGGAGRLKSTALPLPLPKSRKLSRIMQLQLHKLPLRLLKRLSIQTLIMLLPKLLHCRQQLPLLNPPQINRNLIPNLNLTIQSQPLGIPLHVTCPTACLHALIMSKS